MTSPLLDYAPTARPTLDIPVSVPPRTAAPSETEAKRVPRGRRPRKPSSWKGVRHQVQLAERHARAPMALGIIALLLLGFAATVGPIGALRHNRDQQTAFANLRLQLAKGTAPLNDTDPLNPNQQLPVGAATALLTIPQLKLHEVVFNGTNAQVLMKGPGHLRDTPLPGQPGVSYIEGREAGFGGPFHALRDLKAGQIFTVTTDQGVQKFRVLDVRRAGDPQPPALAAGKSRLVLITADGPYFLPSGTLRVDADLVSPVQPAGAYLSPSALPANESLLAGDNTQWLWIALWSQALLVAILGVTWAWHRWGHRQAWAVGIPLISVLGFTVLGHAAALLPNVL